MWMCGAIVSTKDDETDEEVRLDKEGKSNKETTCIRREQQKKLAKNNRMAKNAWEPPTKEIKDRSKRK